MPTYKVTAPNGKTVSITGDTAPTEADLDEIFNTAGVTAPVVSPAPSAPTRAPGLATIGDQIGGKLGVSADVVTGALKGAGNTVFGLGKLFHDYTPIGRISDAIQPGAFDRPLEELKPRNTAQKVGYGGEQIGEFLLPGPSKITEAITAGAKLGKAGQIARAVGQTITQGGSPLEAGASGVLTAALPGGSITEKASGALRESAEKSVAQALGATKEWAKADAAKLAPQILERGLWGSRKGMLETAKSNASRVGDALNVAYDAAAKAGGTVDGDIIRTSLQRTRDALKVAKPDGTLVTIPGSEPVISKLGELAKFVEDLGPDVPIDKAAHIKRTMDQIVSKAGLFGPKATASATDNGSAWAIREASNAFRELLNRNPSIAELNKEASFWTGLKNVLKETEKRTQAQRGGLTDAVRSAAGATVGAAAAGPVGGAIGAVALQGLSKAWNSPAFKTAVAGPAKVLLADALASGSTAQILGAVNRIAAALPAQAQ
jgi:hypothetical protein